MGGGGFKVTTPEIPDAVIDAAERAIATRREGRGQARIAVRAALAATDEHGRIYYHRAELAEYVDALREFVEYMTLIARPVTVAAARSLNRARALLTSEQESEADGLRAENDRWAKRVEELRAERDTAVRERALNEPWRSMYLEAEDERDALQVRLAEYADALRAARPYVVDGTTAGHIDALLAEHERETP